MSYCPNCLSINDYRCVIEQCNGCNLTFKYNLHTDLYDVIYIPGWNRKGRINKTNFEEYKND